MDQGFRNFNFNIPLHYRTSWILIGQVKNEILKWIKKQLPNN